MKAKDKIIIIALIIIAFIWAIYMIRSILTPFVISMVLAYFLHPLVDLLSKKIKVSRLISTALIMGLFSTVFAVVFIFVFPIIYGQFSELILTLPQYLKTFTEEVYPKFATSLNGFGIAVNPSFEQLVSNKDVASSAIGFLRDFVGNVILSSMAVINVFSLLFITPILIFYLLKDWNLLVEKVYGYIPSKYNPSVKKLFGEIDTALSGYVRGQINVCLILGVIYGILLTFTGLNFGFLIGLLTGLLFFIPYVGFAIGLVLGLVVALFQWDFNLVSVAPVALVFMFGQILETNFLTPKLVGNKIGVHPVWIIFGIFVFGVLFGFLGVLFATPLTAIFGVLIKHLAFEYKKRIS